MDVLVIEFQLVHTISKLEKAEAFVVGEVGKSEVNLLLLY